VTERPHWDPVPGDEERIAEHLRRQRGVDPAFVRLDDGTVRRVGADAEGEAESDHCG